jgi:hypothetical protein
MECGGMVYVLFVIGMLDVARCISLVVNGVCLLCTDAIEVPEVDHESIRSPAECMFDNHGW